MVFLGCVTIDLTVWDLLDTVRTNPDADGWVTEVLKFRLEPNPPWEILTMGEFISYPAYVDQVVIDTICIPEPGTLVLLAVGCVRLLVRPRRRRAG